MRMTSLSKNIALQLYCYFRQAERSVHFALSSPSEWPLFVDYYDKSKQTQIADLIVMLKDTGVWQDKVPKRQEFEQKGLLNFVRCVAGLIFNRWKRSWAFSGKEISFFSITFEHLLRILQRPDMPQLQEMIELRLNCFESHYIIAQKLIGLQEISKASSIEHFNQSDHISHVTLQEIVFQNPNIKIETLNSFRA